MVSPEEQVRVEGELAQRLSQAPSHDRRSLYGPVYDEIYDMHLGRDPGTIDFGAGPELLPFLCKLTAAGDRVLEVGCGGGLLAVELARRGRSVVGLEVSARILDQARQRADETPGLTLTLATGIDIPAPAQEFDFAYSVEVLEHLHADDVPAHLLEVYRVLRPGGRHWLLTPNRLDSVSSARRFRVTVEAGGDVHLKEWTYGELAVQLRRAGFRELRSPWRNARMAWLPLMPLTWFHAAERLPATLLRHRLVRSLAGIVACSIVAEKPR